MHYLKKSISIFIVPYLQTKNQGKLDKVFSVFNLSVLLFRLVLWFAYMIYTSFFWLHKKKNLLEFKTFPRVFCLVTNKY